MRVPILLLTFAVVSGCAATAEESQASDSLLQSEVTQRQSRLDESSEAFWRALPRNRPKLGIRLAVPIDESRLDLSYNPELRRMGFRVANDGKLKRLAGDGEVDAAYGELAKAQGFGR